MTDDGSTQQPEQKSTKAKPTKYIVLRQTMIASAAAVAAESDPDPTEAWIAVGQTDAPNDTAAIVKVAGSEQGTFVAVPARSFRPKTRKVKQVEQTSWE